MNKVSPVPKYAFANVRIDESGICSVAGLYVSSFLIHVSGLLSSFVDIRMYGVGSECTAKLDGSIERWKRDIPETSLFLDTS